MCLTLALTCCSHQKPISRDELKSKLRSASSIAAETTAFVDYVRQQRATEHYAKGHLEYLRSELAHTSQELRDSPPPAGAEAQTTECHKQVDALAAALSELRRDIDRPEELAREQGRIAAIRIELERTISSL